MITHTRGTREIDADLESRKLDRIVGESLLPEARNGEGLRIADLQPTRDNAGVTTRFRVLNDL